MISYAVDYASVFRLMRGPDSLNTIYVGNFYGSPVGSALQMVFP